MPDIPDLSGSFKPIDILLVEDSRADIKITLKAFDEGRIKNKIQVVSDGQEALDLIGRKGKYQDSAKFPMPELILMDIIMPKMDGFQTLQKLKEDENTKHIPVVMLTSSQNEQDILKSYRYGAVSYIPKPVVYDDFVRVIHGFNFYWYVVSRIARKLSPPQA